MTCTESSSCIVAFSLSPPFLCVTLNLPESSRIFDCHLVLEVESSLDAEKVGDVISVVIMLGDVILLSTWLGSSWSW